MIEFINGTLYSCACGYKTLYKDYASKHTKTKKCMNNIMTKRDVEFVLKEDHQKTRPMVSCNCHFNHIVTL